MRVVVLGGHGKVALHLLRLLAEDGHEGVGIVRKPEQLRDLEAIGAEGVVLDIENEDIPVDVVAGADAVVMAAGAGPGSGAERKHTVDYGGAVKLIDAAERAAVARYLMVSSVGANRRPEGDEGMAPYLRAKHDADEALMRTELEWTVVRPHGLTDAPGTRSIEVGQNLDRGQIPRDDVAATLFAALHEPRSIRNGLRGETGRRAPSRTPWPRSMTAGRHTRRRSVAQRDSSCRLESWSLRSTADTCASTVFAEIDSRCAISLYM